MNSSILKISKYNVLKEISNKSLLKTIANLNPSKISLNLFKGSVSSSVHHTHTLSSVTKSFNKLPPIKLNNNIKKTIKRDFTPSKNYSKISEEKLVKCMDGNEAAATIAYSINDVSFVYPITPSSVMAECVDNWSAGNKLNIWGNVVKCLEMESEAGVAGALHGALSAGALATSFTSSQGLLLMLPNMYKIAGELLPCVLHVASRAIATHALSIFGDHSDVMAARSTGWNMICSDSVQTSLDMALVAQMATFQCSLPFIHFFEGFRVSHEISKVKLISNHVIKTLVDQHAIDHFRNRALNPTHPSAKGSSQGSEFFFQNVEAANKYYEQVPDIVEQCMNKLNFAVGRRYNLFDYYGPKDATDVIVIMGSGSYVCKIASEYLNNNCNGKTGVLNVRLFRPWSKKHFLGALPDTVERIAVLDRCKENGSNGEPLYTDVCTTLFSKPMSKPIRVIGGRYGIASKDFTPGMAIAVYENLISDDPKVKFTVGIDDDVTNLSLPYQNFDNLGSNVIQCLFWGFGSDGTVGANKDAIKIIGDNTDLFGQAYFAYSAHKSRGITTSHLRFGPDPINAPYLINAADYIAVHYSGYISKFDILAKLKPNGIFVLNTDWPIEELDKYLPYWVKQQLAEKMPKFYIIDANKIANEIGLNERINMIMQSVFFYLAKVIPYKEATNLIKQAIDKTYSSKGADIIQKNKKCVDLAISNLKKVPIPIEWKYSKRDDYFSEIKSLSEFVNNVVIPSHHLKGNEVPVSKLTVDGSVEPGTSKYEKLLSSKAISIYDPTKCIQCNKCTLICPHAAIRPVLIDNEKLKEAPQGFFTRLLKSKKAKLNYRIQVSPYDCTGCTLCVNVCPTKSLSMKSTRENLKREDENYKFSQSLPIIDDLFKKESIKGSQFRQPLLEFSGACEGCQETVYVKLLTQLYGDHLVIANATGCSSIWGLSCPTNPFTIDKHGYGPAWANSLFEDNAEFGFGIHHGYIQRRKHLKDLMEKLIQPDSQIKLSKKLKDIIPKWIKTFDDYDANRKISDQLEKLLTKEKSNDPKLEEIYQHRDLLRAITTWIVGGDGWAYDIGYSGVDHVLASGDRVRILVLDTECYSNTGGQASKSTPLGAVQFFSKNGKSVNKKELGLMAMQYRNVYVASVSIAANAQQALKAFIEAEAFPGPSIIVAHSPCQLHGIRGGLKNVIDEAKLAVDSGYWPLYRYNPVNKEQPFIYESLNIRDNVAELLKNENRFSQLIRKNPEYGQELTKKAQQYYLRRHQYLLSLANEETLKDTSAFTSIHLKQNDNSEISKLDANILAHIKELFILYGTEYGTSEAIAKILVKDAIEHGCPKVNIMEANKFNVNEDLDKIEYLIFICSTTGNGQFPQNAQTFWNNLSKYQKSVPNLKYSVFGLGDSSYAQYCYTAKVVDSKLAELGAKNIYQLTLTDDKVKTPIEIDVEKWEINIFKNLGSNSFETPVVKENYIDPNLKQLDIIFDSEGGFTDVIVTRIINDIMKTGEYNAIAHEAGNLDMEKLTAMNEVIIVTAPSSKGELPPSSKKIWEEISKADQRYHELENMKYSIISIEDSSYARSGEIAHLLDEKLKSLGGHRIVKASTIDVNSDVNRQDLSYNNWMNEVYKALNILKEKKPKINDSSKKPTSHDQNNKIQLDKIDIIYGSETGQSEIASEMFAEDAENAGISEVEIHVADKVELEDLKKMKDVIYIISTSGEGEFPSNAVEFWDRLSKATPETLNLKEMNFTVYGLGDSKYEKFCEAARLINEKVESLGGKRFYPFKTLDDQSEKDPEIEVRMWIGNVINELTLIHQNSKPEAEASSKKIIATSATSNKKENKKMEQVSIDPNHICVIYGTELGSSEKIANKVLEEGLNLSLPVEVVEADKVKLEDLPKVKNVIFISSTSGDGEFPPNALQFWDKLSKASPETLNLKNMNFTVFGLGDSTYEKFCEAARLVNEKFEILGAKRFYPYTTIDDNAIDRNQDIEVNNWINNVLNKLANLNPEYSENTFGARKEQIISKNNIPDDLHIIYGTELGNSERIAKMVSEKARNSGLSLVNVIEADKVKLEDLNNMKNVIFISSTSSDGEFPPNALQFWSKLSKATSKTLDLKNMKFAVFGLGDSTYEKFCEAARLVNEKLEALGAKRFYPYTTIDDNAINRNQDADVTNWINGIMNKLNLKGNSSKKKISLDDSVKESTIFNKREKELNILFGTQCGLSEDVAHVIGEEAEKRGFTKVTVNGANKVPMEKFKTMNNVLVVTSTVDGTFPPSIFKFYNRITSDDKLDLSHMKFSVLGLGGSNHEKFCEAARLINKRLEELGATRYLQYTTFDDQDKEEILDKLDKYMNTLFKSLNNLKDDEIMNKTNSTDSASLKSNSMYENVNEKILNVLFGTQCGLAEDVANVIGEEAEKRGFTKVTVNGANKVPMEKFKTMNNVLVVTSTVDGTFPPSIFKFYNRITSDDKLDLSHMKFSVLGLGGSNHEKFCEAARLINKRLEELGATRYLQYTTFDDQDKEEILDKLDKYMDKLFKSLDEEQMKIKKKIEEEKKKSRNNESKAPSIIKQQRKKAKAIAKEKVINIIYGTDLGSTETAAKKVAEAAKENGFVRVNIYEADSVDIYGLMKMKTVVFLMPTSGEGEFPPDALLFWKRLSQETKDTLNLSKTKYAVLGLGDSSYRDFCKAAKFLDKKLSNLGAVRFQKFTVIDENDIQQNPDLVIENWQQEIFDKLGAQEVDENGNRRDAYPIHSKGVRHDRAKICDLNIIHGTERGLTEDISELLGEEALNNGFSEVTVCGANKIQLDDIKKMKYVVIVTTTVDGTLPPSIAYFWNRISKETKISLDLSKLNFAVIGIDNKNNPKFCEAAKMIDNKLEELGGKRFFKYTTIDNSNEKIVEKEIQIYSEGIYASLKHIRDPNAPPYVPKPKSEPKTKPIKKEIPTNIPVIHTKENVTKNNSNEPIELLDVIFGTETGSSEAIADMISEDAKKAGISKVVIHPADSVSLDELKNMKYVTFVTSTSGEGEFPPNAIEFWNRLSKATKDNTSLTNMKFTVLGLGDSSYSKFCEAGRLVNEKFEKLGGKRFFPYSTLDDQSDKDQEEEVNKWIQDMLKNLTTSTNDDNHNDNNNNNNDNTIQKDKSKTEVKSVSTVETSSKSIELLDVIFGTETGSSEAIADMISEDAKKAGISKVVIHPADSVSLDELKNMKYVTFVTSTSGEGEFPPNAIEFWNRLSKATKDNTSLTNMKFTVLGLGDSSYSKFCEAGRLVNEKFEKLGGKRFFPYTTLDDQSDKDQEEEVNKWIQDMLKNLTTSTNDDNHNNHNNNNNNNTQIDKSKAEVKSVSTVETSSKSIELLDVIFGTETGSSEAIADMISEDAKKAGISKVVIHPADSVSLDELKNMKYVTFVTSTSGEGEFPPNAIEFWNRLSKATKDNTSLTNMKFTVLGLGDSSYSKFCEAGRLVNEKFEKLGGKRFFPYTTLDDQSDKDQEEEVNKWIQDMLKNLTNSTNGDGNSNNGNEKPVYENVKTEKGTFSTEENNETSTEEEQSEAILVNPIACKASCQSVKSLDIIFGTETGSSEAIADIISENAKKAGISEVIIHPANSVSLDDLKKMKNVAFVSSTSGDGEFPPNAIEFWNRLSKATKDNTSLDNLKFAILGLGDSSYSKFCEATRLVNEKFEDLGAKRICKYVTIDDQSEENPEDIVNRWVQDLLQNLSGTEKPVSKINKSVKEKSNLSDNNNNNNESIELLDVIFGTETGTSEAIADMISEDAKKAGISKVVIHPADSVSLDELKNMKYVTFVTSTSGEGEFPPNAIEFWNRLSKATKDNTSLTNMKFTVLGLGDSSYSKFCEAGRLVNEKFEKLGGKRFFPYTTLDDQSDKDQEEEVNKWIQDFLKSLNSGNNKKSVSDENISEKETTSSVTSNEDENSNCNIKKCDLQTEFHVIYGTKTNHSKDIANMIISDAKNAGFPFVYVHEANTIDVQDLLKMKNFVFIVPTYSGKLPEDCLNLWNKLSSMNKETFNMSNVKYSVLGLGYRTSPRYCIAAKALNKKFQDLGTIEFYPYTELDIEHAENPENIINSWSEKLLNSLIELEAREMEEDVGRRSLINDSDDQLNIIFGTESEHAQDVAGMLSDEAKEAGITNINIFSADRIDIEDLRKMKTLIIVTSTFKGTFPPNAHQFWNRLNKVDKSTARFENMKYAVFGLGDSQREKFCEAARLMDEKFERLGAQRFYKYTTLDSHGNDDQIKVINNWIHEILNIIIPYFKNNNKSNEKGKSTKLTKNNSSNANKNIKKCDLQVELHVIFGTKSTHAEDIAAIVALDARDAGFPFVYTHEADTFKVDDLLKMKNIIFITSTVDGNFPPDAIELWKELSQKTKKTFDMSKIKYAVLGIGDKNKKDFCAAARKLNKQFQNLGASEIYKYTELNFDNSDDVVTSVNHWSEELLNSLICIETHEIEEDVGRRSLINDSDDQLNIIFGTESEHAQDVAGMLSDEAKEAGITNINIFSADRIDIEDLRKMKTLIIVTSTFKGTFPPNAHQFWNRLNKVDKSTARFENMKYAVFGLGDSKRKKFCEAARLIDEKFESLGAQRFYKYTTLDKQQEEKEIDIIEQWIQEILKRINIPKKNKN